MDVPRKPTEPDPNVTNITEKDPITLQTYNQHSHSQTCVGRLRSPGVRHGQTDGEGIEKLWTQLAHGKDDDGGLSPSQGRTNEETIERIWSMCHLDSEEYNRAFHECMNSEHIAMHYDISCGYQHRQSAEIVQDSDLVPSSNQA
ncbi:hypothetical protein C8J56DRAFT_1053915 [Mycena floridula]|nr:hypothetical protein C8J56DRAFT_1053915 [Mycena floridula]